MERENNITGNIGEWSELYALAFILANSGMYGADEDQNRRTDIFYQVLRVIFAEKPNEPQHIYVLKDDVIEIYKNNEKIGEAKANKIKKVAGKMFNELSVFNEGRAFNIDSGSEMMKILKKDYIKAPSSDKKDLDMVMIDLRKGQSTPEIGFSVKSQLGSPSTLINASRATNFTYEILDKDFNVPEKLPKLHERNVKDNVELLINSGFNLKLHGLDSETFEKNLSLIDSNLADYLAKVLVSYYSRDASKISELVEIVFSKGNSKNEQAAYKIEEFLSLMALGMMPNTEWNGDLTSLGGIILVKKDGDVLCYYLYNLDDFKKYLLKNTKLETPSTSRYGIGHVIEENGRCFIKLNLQVRFLR